METVGFIASVITLAGIIKACGDALDTITTAQNMSKDLIYLITHLQTERIRFFNWCQITGLSQIAVQTDSWEQDPLLFPQNSIRHDDMLLPQFQLDFIVKHLQFVASNMLKTLKDIEDFLGTYQIRGEPKFWSLIGRRRDERKKRLALVEISQLNTNFAETTMTTRTKQRNYWNEARWALRGKQTLTEHIEMLRKHNDDLVNILESTNQVVAQRLRRWTESSVTATPMAQIICDSQSWEENLETTPSDHPPQLLLTLSQMSMRRTELASLDEIGIDETPNAPSKNQALTDMRASTINLVEDLFVNSRELQFPNEQGDSLPLRQFGSYRNRAVIIEWRYFSSQLSEKDRCLLDSRIHALAMQLRQSIDVSGFNILPCLGYFLAENDHRYGIVFTNPNSSVAAVSLRQRLVRDFKEGLKCDLGDRLRFARAFTASLFRFFSVGWLHKNINSDSILFFEGIRSNHYLTTHYFAGFSFSRPGSPCEQTEAMPSIFNKLRDDREWQLYRHPDLNYYEENKASSKPPGSSMFYDSYSLGIVLLEIALWCPIIKLCSRGSSVADFQAKVATKFEQQLRFCVGERYANVVRRCLTGDFGEIQIGKLSDTDFELFLEAFEALVVTELELETVFIKT